MFKKITNVFYLFFFFIFFILIFIFYFSEQNIINTNKFVSFNYMNKDFENNLPIIKNDTKDIIEYTDGVENFKNNKKKYKFYDLLDK
tara:strand:- start:2 stop:262 length:261 start_codon:yes stop_codon:yes gene_type:complete